MNKHLNKGYIMAVIGFIMILANALDYIFGWNYFSPAFAAIGMVFVVIGMKLGKRI